MTNGPPRHALGLLLLAVALGGLVFAFDLSQGLGHAVGMAYVLMILLGLWMPFGSYPLWAAIVATLLVVADVVLDWTSPPPSTIFVNRPLMILLFWTTAAVVVRFKRLQRSSARQVKDLADLKYALDQAAIVATTDVRGRITYVNEKFCEISKYSADELLGQDHRIVNSGLHPKSFFQHLWYTIASGRVWQGEIRNRAKDGSFYWVDTTIVPFVDANGKPSQYTAIRFDITERKSAEGRLREQEALARVGQLAAVVAHEVKNPLAGIRGAMQVMRSRRSTGDPESTVMRDIIERIDALTDLIQDLQLYARPRAPRLERLDLRSVLLDAIASMRRDPAGERIGVDLQGPDVALAGDTELIRAAFLNVLLNAAQAMNGDGSIHLAISRTTDHVTVSVRDEGPGIAADIRERVFEPFFTTKTRGGGLGLAIVRRTMALHGGVVAIDAPEEGGTAVTLTLPLKPPTAVEEMPVITVRA